jgi:hypothetical protein
MAGVAEAAIAGFNQLLRDQQQAPGEARLTLALFDDHYEVPINSVPIAEVVELDTTTFVPRGSTALLDAIGRTIDELGQRLADTPEALRPGTTIVAILTDGLENASTRFTWQEVAARIRHQQDHYQWQFLFLGAQQDAIATAANLNIRASHACTLNQAAEDFLAAKGAISRKIRASRAKAAGWDDSETQLAEAMPLSDLVRAEKDRPREA